MSRVEHTSWKHADCLCGSGQVTKHVSSTDYAFGSADISYSLDCATCSREWRLDRTTLVLCSSEKDYHVAEAEAQGVSEQIRVLMPGIVDAHFDFMGYPTRVGELAEMHRLGLSGMNYRAYTAERRKGRTPGQVANIWRDDAVKGLAEIAAPKDRPEVARLYKLREELQKKSAAAVRRIVRKAPPNPT